MYGSNQSQWQENKHKTNIEGRKEIFYLMMH